jgi:hypothetical protein
MKFIVIIAHLLLVVYYIHHLIDPTAENAEISKTKVEQNDKNDLNKERRPDMIVKSQKKTVPAQLETPETNAMNSLNNHDTLSR